MLAHGHLGHRCAIHALTTLPRGVPGTGWSSMRPTPAMIVEMTSSVCGRTVTAKSRAFAERGKLLSLGPSGRGSPGAPRPRFASG